MPFELTAEDARVLGALIEKENTTPDYYPLTLNSLMNACNQKSNREPVMNLNEQAVLKAIDHLRDLQFGWTVHAADSRVPKYEQSLDRFLGLTLQEIAVLCVLLLRGPQTPGELRARSSRIYPFEGMDEVNLALDSLSDREEPLVTRLPLQPGRKEARYMHLMSGEPDLEAAAEAAAPVAVAAPVATVDNEAVEALEEEINDLRGDLEAVKSQLAGLQSAFETFKAQFD